MTYNFTHLKTSASTSKEWLIKELSGIRTGRASPSVLDTIFVETFGAMLPVKQLASINVEDAKTLRIIPWDTDQIKNVEKAIISSGLGLSIAADEKGIRLTFPDLTAERRELMIKAAKGKMEESKIKLRMVRDDVWKDIQSKEKEGSISEDDKFRLKDEMQKVIDIASKEIDEAFNRKEKEIRL